MQALDPPRPQLSDLQFLSGNARRVDGVPVRMRLRHVERLQQLKQPVEIVALARAEAERQRHSGFAVYRPPEPALLRLVAGEAPHLVHFRLRSRGRFDFKGVFLQGFQGTHGSRATAQARSYAGSMRPCLWKCLGCARSPGCRCR